MNSEKDNQLEREISNVLQGLPDLAAPPSLLARTMNALQQPAPARFQPWTKWSLAGRIAFVVLALGTVAGVVTEWMALKPALLGEATRLLAPLTARIEGFRDILGAFAGAIELAVKHLGQGFMLGCMLVALVACAVCAGFGTIFVRLALARPGRNEL